MAQRNSFQKLLRANNERGLLCVGLDPSPTLKRDGVLEAMKAIVDATAVHTAAFKPNLSFYLHFDRSTEVRCRGQEILHRLCGYIRRIYPDHVLVLDSKDGDIGKSNDGYLERAFERYKADFVTWQPYFGAETVTKALSSKYPDKGIFTLVRTSNPEATAIQNCTVGSSHSQPLFLEMAGAWRHEQVGFVTGATNPEDLARIRARFPNTPLLCPGIGTQGGDIEKTVRVAYGENGAPCLINVSSDIANATNPGEKARFYQAEFAKFQ